MYNPATPWLNKRSIDLTLSHAGFMNQGKEAAGSHINGSIGVALKDVGTPCLLDSLSRQYNGNEDDLLYSGCYGMEELRNLWKLDISNKNPTLVGSTFSNPLVTAGLTHGLNLAGNLFLSPQEPLILSSPVYDNYQHSFGGFFQADLKPFPLLKEGRFNTPGLKEVIEKNRNPVIKILLNFPNNPLGYSLTQKDADALKVLIEEYCQQGRKILMILDDAYFGLFYEDHLIKESLFSYFADLHENLLLMKIDGSSKEYFAWGLRIGFVSFQCKGWNDKTYKELEDRAAAIVRSTVSNVSRLTQSMMIRVLKDPSTQEQKKKFETLLLNRYTSIRQYLDSHKEYSDQFKAIPFNSGYFFCIELREGIDSHILRKILRTRDIGLISPNSQLLRIAFSSLSESVLPRLFDEIYRCCLNYEELKEQLK
ncbi:MAG: aminotransferase class I/II-fold pyridoxal phosphate-dependent enzyme [Bacteroidales bacterium]|jgi:aspartate/methionine/tyrosine aminotransferase|nr:aminotransferase class I/II-fold pyridoxal phosphate-dependent enzyme [Bacteroidales bacterium]